MRPYFAAYGCDRVADPLASRPRSHRRVRAAGLDLNARPGDILARFVSRWQVEVTFVEVRAHLGVETQRKWSGDPAHYAGSARLVLDRNALGT